MKTKTLKLALSALMMIGLLGAGMAAHANERTSATYTLNERGPITINTAKKAATEFFKESVNDATLRIRFQKKNSKEYTVEYLLQQMEYIGSNNLNYQRYEALANELKKDKSLRMFSIFLATGSAETATQDIFLVKLKKLDDGKVLAEVIQD